MSILKPEHALTINGVEGRAHNVIQFEEWAGRSAGLLANQTWRSESRDCSSEYGGKSVLVVEIRFDDNCKNGHESFAITGVVYRSDRLLGDPLACGCLHDDIERFFPELAPLIKWHLTSTDGPMHYVANTVYHASNRDVWGCLKGEPSRFAEVLTVGSSPLPVDVDTSFKDFLKSLKADFDTSLLAPVALHHDRDQKTFKPKYTFAGLPCDKWHKCPFDSLRELETWREVVKTHLIELSEGREYVHLTRSAVAWGEGKERDLETARSSAIWPEASDEILCSDKETLTVALNERLPALLADFKKAVTEAGLLWSPK